MNIPMIRVVLACWLVAQCVYAQEAAVKHPVGFVRLFDAVGVGTGKLDFRIDGRSVRPAGYQTGDVTGGIALEPGFRRVEVIREGVGKHEVQIKVEADVTSILIAFAEQVPSREQRPPRWRMRVLCLSPHVVEDKRTASFVSVSREPEIQLGVRQSNRKWETVFVKRLDVSRVDIQQSRGYVPVRCDGGVLSSISVGASGNFVSVLYDDENGVLRSRVFQDYHYTGGG